ncbi:MAG: hypothetical protein AB7R89_02625 [Dehalococcoidia bacterium]
MLEKEGIPTVVVGTDEFLQLAQLECKARGMPDLRLAITHHPIGGLKPEQVAVKADAMIDAAVTGVTDPSPR